MGVALTCSAATAFVGRSLVSPVAAIPATPAIVAVAIGILWAIRAMRRFLLSISPPPEEHNPQANATMVAKTIRIGRFPTASGSI